MPDLQQKSILGLALIMAPFMQAAVLTNGSFETPASDTTPSLPVGSTYLDGWTVILAEIAHCAGCADFQSAGGGSASDGNLSLDLTGYHDAPAYGGVRQVFATVPGQQYRVTFDVGAREGTSTVELTVGSTVASGSSTSAGSEVVWTPSSVLFVASDAATTLELRGTQASWEASWGVQGGIFIGLDHVEVTPVPEPAGALAVLGLAAVGATLGRRRKP